MTYVLKRIMLVFLGLSTIVMLAGYARAQAPADVNGTWTGTTQRGASTIKLVLKQDGQKVTGTLSGAGATDDGPVEGMVDGDTIKLKNKTGATPTLNIKGDQITGMLSSGTVTLKRAK
jgi:endonuclease YncB( thermonuclease family)